MMPYDKLTNAIAIFNKLLQNGELNIAHSDMYPNYVDPETYEIFIKIAESSNVVVKKVDEMLYLLPNMDNTLFGFSDREIRQRLYSLAGKEDLYLFEYILVIIFGKFYSSTGDSPKLLTHISINDLINHITNSLSTVNQKEDVEDIEKEYGINIRRLFIKWDGLLTQSENPKPTLSEKRGVLKRVIDFMEDAKLINYYENEDIIKTTKRCDDIMISFFLSYDRKEKINEFLEYQRGIMLNAEDKQD